MVFEAREEQLQEEKRQEEIMEALKAEQRLMDHLESIRYYISRKNDWPL